MDSPWPRMALMTRTILVAACFLITGTVGPAIAAAASTVSEAGSTETRSGAMIYRDLCARCHGTEGQGVDDEYDEPLHGDRSISSLARLIERTMPEDEPDHCVGDDARRVAEFIHREFYSPEARQARGRAPRIELLRLTVPQYRNVVADLLGRFTPVPRRAQSADEVSGGLRAEYFQSKGMNKADDLRLERVDRRIDFDFGEGGPAENIEPDQFAIVWDGALNARDTGFYEFRVRSENGIRLYLNNDAMEQRRKLRDDSSVAGQAALVDAWVSSGEMREHRARVFLMGGRSYPFRLEFFKYKEKTASIRLEWKAPHGAWALLDHRHLSTASVPRTFVVDTPFPADDRSLGYERGSAVSAAWHAATTRAAIATAAEVVNRLPLLAGFDQGDPERGKAARRFTVRFAEVAFRRPLTDGEKHVFGEVLFENAPNPEAAVRRAVLLALNTPDFLYTDLTGADEAPTQHAIAARLSLALWDSIPDEPLLEAARDGQLVGADRILAEARRMTNDPRTRSKLGEFFNHWLELDERDLAKDRSLFPTFDEVLVADLRDSLHLFIEQIVWSDESDYRQLLLADHLVLNQPLRQFYETGGDENAPGHERPESGGDSADPAESLAAGDAALDEFEPVVFAPERRAGILTHPYLLSAFAYHNNTSPIHRGVFLTRNIIGRDLKPPPVAVAFKDSEFPSDITMREKIAELTRDKACMSCHSVINPLGFALENYDAVGRWRTTDNEKPVDSRSQFVSDEGDTVEVGSARDIARFAVGSRAAHRAFTAQIFHHLIKQDPYAYGSDTLERLREDFVADQFNIRNLLARIAATAAGHGNDRP